MSYRGSVAMAVRLAIRNPFGLVLVSLAFSLALTPFITSTAFPSPLTVLAGLWASSLLTGIVLIGGFSLATVVVERSLSLGTSHFWEGIRRDWQGGFVVGAGTFLVSLVTTALVVNPFDGLVGTSLGVAGAHLFAGWWLLVAFSLPWYVTGTDLRTAFRNGALLILEQPVAAVWVVAQGLGWGFIAVVTIVTPVLLLPGFLVVLVTTVVEGAASGSEVVTPWTDQ